MHLIAMHLLCGAVDRCVQRLEGERESRLPDGARRRSRGGLAGSGARR
jgi:hypothetical protein